jgi:hypothetical protein
MRNTLAIILAVATLSPLAMAQKESHATDRLDASADILMDMMHADDKGIPQDLMNKANCVPGRLDALQRPRPMPPCTPKYSLILAPAEFSLESSSMGQPFVQTIPQTGNCTAPIPETGPS